MADDQCDIVESGEHSSMLMDDANLSILMEQRLENASFLSSFNRIPLALSASNSNPDGADSEIRFVHPREDDKESHTDLPDRTGLKRKENTALREYQNFIGLQEATFHPSTEKVCHGGQMDRESGGLVHLGGDTKVPSNLDEKMQEYHRSNRKSRSGLESNMLISIAITGGEFRTLTYGGQSVSFTTKGYINMNHLRRWANVKETQWQKHRTYLSTPQDERKVIRGRELRRGVYFKITSAKKTLKEFVKDLRPIEEIEKHLK